MTHLPTRNAVPQSTSPELIVDLNAVVDNYKTLQGMVSGECSGVIKANAYGMGSNQIAQALSEEGCETFFVALASEGVEIRALLPNATIFVLSPFLALDCELLKEHKLVPCLYDIEGINHWISAHSGLAPVALHFETGINRLGLSAQNLETLLSDKTKLGQLDIKLVMSHLSSGDEQQSRHNPEQLKAFKMIRAEFPNVPASLANTGGILLGSEYHFDLVRPGIGLYGHDPHYYENNCSRLKTVATFRAPLAQIKHLKSNDSVGYGATEMSKDSEIGVILCGYADGVMRAFFRHETREGHKVALNGFSTPMLGRVSMDMITIDLTDIPSDAYKKGDMVEIFGPNSLVEDAAVMAGTSAYELFTRVSDRTVRKYV
ncbi:alanine racemase [Kiloniella majae]|uniref:alanine racemase n=1 Tax=Kiloniella majae TaxID=1938558 RepID=UPI000A278D83|nr:alanine racemase [Kiloniella majae]